MRRWRGMARRQDDNSVSRGSVVADNSRAASEWTVVEGGVTAPAGFLAAGITAGMKHQQPDLALVLAPEGAVCRRVHHLGGASRLRDLCAERLVASGGKARAVLINSGQANACTGDRGLIDSQRATQSLADRLGVDADQVLICSTGVIGVPIPMEVLLVVWIRSWTLWMPVELLLGALIWWRSRSPWPPWLGAGSGSGGWPKDRDDPSRHGHHARYSPAMRGSRPMRQPGAACCSAIVQCHHGGWRHQHQ